jgi:flavin-dependent dehydrogenase
MKDILVIGAGPAGLSCVLTLLASKARFPFAKDLDVEVVDAGNSDLLKAEINYTAGIKIGTNGKDEIDNIVSLIKSHEPSFAINSAKVVSIKKSDSFEITLDNGNNISAKRVVIATGFHSYDIDGLALDVIPHRKSPRDGKIMIKNIDHKVDDNLYVAGLVAGALTMYSCASGSGCEVACDILSEIAGKTVVVHDVVK